MLFALIFIVGCKPKNETQSSPSTPEQALMDLGINLPEASSPANYVNGVSSGNLIFLKPMPLMFGLMLDRNF